MDANKPMKKPNILISNDDGIEAPGLQRLAEELKEFSNVYVSAPYRQQSAVGHSITIFYPLRAHEHRINGKPFGIAVDGTPADAVKLGVLWFYKDIKFDLIVSGINHGSNTAINIIYSGTVSGAAEGSILGIPSVAISLTTFEPNDFTVPAKISAKLIRRIMDSGKGKLKPGTILNINIPSAAESEIRGVKITKQGKSYWEDSFEVRADPNGRDYYWLTGKMVITDKSNENDIIAVKENYISITPLHYDLTDHESIEQLRKLNLKI